MTFILLAVSLFFVTAATVIYHYRGKIRVWLHRQSIKLKMGTIRTAIHGADKDKAETGRKNMVIYNTVSKEFEPVQKKVLKRLEQTGKNNSPKMTKYRRKQGGVVAVKSKRKLESGRTKQIEKSSLYVTK